MTPSYFIFGSVVLAASIVLLVSIVDQADAATEIDFSQQLGALEKQFSQVMSVVSRKRRRVINQDVEVFPRSLLVAARSASNCTDGGSLRLEWVQQEYCQCSCKHLRKKKDGKEVDFADMEAADFGLPTHDGYGAHDPCQLQLDAMYYDACRCWC